MSLKAKISRVLLVVYLGLLALIFAGQYLYVLPDLRHSQHQFEHADVAVVFAALELKHQQSEKPLTKFLEAMTIDDINQVVHITGRRFSIYPIKDVGNNKKLAMMAPMLDRLVAGESYRSGEHGYRWIKNDDGDSVAVLEVEHSGPGYDGSVLKAVNFIVLLVVTLLMVLVKSFLHFCVFQPIERANQYLKKVRETSDYTSSLNNTSNDELGELSRECEGLVHYVGSKETYLREVLRDLTKKTLDDELAEVASRRHFDVKYEMQWHEYLIKNKPIYLILINIDNFKAYNDHYGHMKGDDALKIISKAMLSNIRVNTDMFARFSGNEFMVLLTETDNMGARIVSEKLMDAVRSQNIPNEASQIGPRLTISMGVAGWTPMDENREAMVEAAERALQKAREAGRDRIAYEVEDD